MPANKLQHYVPRCYLRAFCEDDAGAAINLFNVARQVAIRGAPAKGQCAKPYFYGKDGELEKALQGPEGIYADCIRRAKVDPTKLTIQDMQSLRSLMMLQLFRSAAWMERQMDFFGAQRQLLEAEGATNELLEHLSVTHAEALDHAMDAFQTTRGHVADLDLCLFVNQTRLEFITSDDPAVHTNRYHAQKGLLGGSGFRSSGAMIFMPLTPTLLLAAFDRHVYQPVRLFYALIAALERRLRMVSGW